jgi:uncharacterized protein YggL (DUF469 family)
VSSDAADEKTDGPAKKNAPGATTKVDSPPRALPAPSQAELKIDAALAKPADVDWIDTQLGDVAAHLSEKYAVPIQLDLAALEADGKNSETLVTKKMRGVNLKQVLRATLDEQGLTYVVRFDQLTITTKAAAETMVRTRVYPVHDLVLIPADSSTVQANVESLIEVITSSVSPETWRESGGTQGDYKHFEGNGVIGLAITHTDEAHERIEQLLANLRAAQTDPVRQIQASQAAAGGQAKKGEAAPPPSLSTAKFYPPRSEADEQLLLQLGRRADVDYVAIELADVAADLSKKYEVPIQLDLPALAAGGLGPDTPITKNVWGVSLRTVLRLILEEHDLTYVFQNDQLVITSQEAAEAAVTTRVYQVHDLTVMPDDPTAAKANMEPLEELIVSIIAPETWREAGGTVGEIKPFVGNGVIAVVVTQNGANHERIESLLESVRAAQAEDVRKLQAGEPGATSPAATAPFFPEPYELDRQVAAALEKTVDLEWIDARLPNVAAEISRKFGLPLQLDLPALTAEGKGSNTLITKKFRKTTLRNILDATLEEKGLVFVAGDRPPRITTKNAAEGFTRAFLYPVADLAWPLNNVTTSQGDDDPLVELIHRTIDPETWRIAGGTQGDIKKYVGNGVVVLAIEQVDRAHEKIQTLLAALRAAQSKPLRRAQAGKAPEADGAPLALGIPPAAAQTYPEPTAAERRIAAPLAKPTDIQWLDTQLGDVAGYLSEKYDLPVQLDVPALKAVGKSSETLINQSVKGVSLENGLRSALDRQGLTFVVAYDQVLITTKGAAERFGSVRVYPVQDLAVMPNDPTASRPNLAPLVDLIESTVSPESWRAAGGSVGEIQAFVGPGLATLTICQSDEGHAKIAGLLSALRQGQSDMVRQSQARRPLGPVTVDTDDDGLPTEEPRLEQAAPEKPPSENRPALLPAAQPETTADEADAKGAAADRKSGKQ